MTRIRPRAHAETNLSTQEAQAKAKPRVPPPNVHQGRPQRPLPTTPQRSQAAERVVERRLRLTQDRDFQRVRREGRSWSSPLLVLRAAENGRDHSRFGFSVGKKVGKAAARNRAKRLMRESIRLRLAEIADGADVVLTARPGIQSSEMEAVDRTVHQLLERAGLLKGGT